MNRDEYLMEVIKILNGEGFVKDSDMFIKTILRQQPGQTMIINGQRFQQPSMDIKTEFIITDLGEVWEETVGVEVKIPREQFKFMIKQNDEIVFELDELMYFEKPELILQHFKK